MEPAFHQMQPFPSYAYPQQADSGYASNQSAGNAAARGAIPISMTMTSITSTVSVGSPPRGTPGPEKTKEYKSRSKVKGKEREKAKTNEPTPSGSPMPKRTKTRKRSSTVQVGALNHKPSSSIHSTGDDRTLRERQSSDRVYSSSSAGEGDNSGSQRGGDSGSERRLLRPGKLRLKTLSFAQVAAMGTPGSGLVSPSQRLTSAVSASTSSFESPLFAHPDSSDYANDA